MKNNAILQQNRESWNAIADDWFGCTALPQYGCRIPKETELKLFGDVQGKKLLDLGCGSGHSLLYHARRGAGELWGLDISEKQLENAGTLLRDHGFSSNLYCAPMEENPGLPQGTFDIVYSIYALGWTTDLPETLRLTALYLKPDGCFIFSWDHPFLHCISPEGGRYVLDQGYFDNRPFVLEKGGQTMVLMNRRVSDYVNALADAGFSIERMIEETDAETLCTPVEFSSRYYAQSKAKLIPLSFVMKARKR